MQFYEVGGCVRDELLGVPSKDIDFTVVLTEEEKNACDINGESPFDFMFKRLTGMQFNIFLSTPEFLTIRAQFPKGHEHSRLTADFVLARKESGYTDGRRPDEVIPGTLLDDLARRDFTMNAIAKDADGSLIDPFGGQRDIALKIIRCVGDPHDRFKEDSLRAIRALRFSVTKGFMIDPQVVFAMQTAATLDAIENKISDERIMDELNKMFKSSTMDTLDALKRFPALTDAMFSGKVNLEATMKQKGRK